MANGRIVVAEDDPKQARLLKLYLEREGHSVIVAEDGLAAVEAIRRRNPDLVLLDMMMPELDGLDVCRVVRAESDVPIIMITARNDEDDMLRVLDLGADDYITKPYRPRELVARVRAMLRRHLRAESDDERTLGALHLDFRRRELRIDDGLVELTAKEFDLLAALTAEPGRVFTRAQLLEAAFGFDYQGLDRTVYGVGYRARDTRHVAE